MNLAFVGMAAALGLSASGSAFGAGFAGQAAVGAWKKCYASGKTGTVHHDRVRWSTSYTDNLRIPSYELYQISSRRRSRRRTGTWCWYLLWTRNRTFSIIPG